MNQIIIASLKYYRTNPGNWKFPWCAAFMNFILKEEGFKGTDSNMARSFLTIGEHTNSPELGDIVVLWRVGRETQWGHCGFYIAEDDYWITLLGGNQNGIVKIKRYPKWQLLDIRKLDV